MASVTPFVKRMRTQGGTMYTFSSALEDIGLNINERNNVVKISHYALLNIPAIDAPNISYVSTSNRFNVLAIPGAFKSWLDSNSIKDGRVIVAESFQNYALNLETFLTSNPNYNPALSTTVSERIFWKWLKETGAIRWTPVSTPAGLYWKEEMDTDSSVGYNSVVKAIGTISAGSVRTDTFGTYNETYILVPTSFGQTPVWFKQIEDDNYYHGMSIASGQTNIMGRNPYTKPHPDGLDIKAYYDQVDTSTKLMCANATYNLYVSDDNVNYIPGWWWTYDNLYQNGDSNKYYINDDSYLTNSVYNLYLKYSLSSGSGPSEIRLKRSNVECLSIEFDINKIKDILGDSTVSFDDLALPSPGYSEDDSYDFNTILIYYSVYNKSLDKILATNLLGVLFLDSAYGNTQYYGPGGMEIVIPSIKKLQSGPSGFGTSYSFRLNIKSDYLLDDTQAIVTDSTNSNNIEDFSTLFDNLGKTLSILNQHTGTINYITEQYLDISSQQTNILNQIDSLQNQINNISLDTSVNTITYLKNLLDVSLGSDASSGYILVLDPCSNDPDKWWAIKPFFSETTDTDQFIPEASLSTDFIWQSGYLRVDSSLAGSGPQGIQGTQGTLGIQGRQGTQGSVGVGLTGATGAQGTAGTQGSQGTQGTQGTQGLIGSTGIQGLAGSPGSTGSQGIQGTQGTQGTQGVQGTLGVQGLQGTQGLQGLQGVQGLSANVDVSIATTSSSMTLTSSLLNKILEATGTVTIYLPTNLEIGFQTTIVNMGTGIITLSASTGATLLTKDSSTKIRDQYTGAMVYKRSSTQWVGFGSLS